MESSSSSSSSEDVPLGFSPTPSIYRRPIFADSFYLSPNPSTSLSSSRSLPLNLALHMHMFISNKTPNPNQTTQLYYRVLLFTFAPPSPILSVGQATMHWPPTTLRGLHNGYQRKTQHTYQTQCTSTQGKRPSGKRPKCTKRPAVYLHRCHVASAQPRRQHYARLRL